MGVSDGVRLEERSGKEKTWKREDARRKVPLEGVVRNRT